VTAALLPLVPVQVPRWRRAETMETPPRGHQAGPSGVVEAERRY